MADVNTNLNEEEILGKAYDSRLMRRLLSYARPYWQLFGLAVVLLLASTVTGLAGPYLTKTAIDDYLNGYSKPMIAVNASSGAAGINFEGRIYRRVDKIPAGTAEGDIYTIAYADGKPYLVNAPGLPADKSGSITVHGSPGGFNSVYAVGGRQYPARQLTGNEIKLFRSGDYNSVVNLGLIYIGLIIAGFLFNYYQTYILSLAGQNIIYNIRQEVFKHLQKMPLGFFDKNPVGRLVTRVTNDTETLNDMYTNVLVNVLKDISILVGVIVILFSMDAKLTLVVLAVIPAVIAITVVFRIKAREVYRRVRVTLARINAVISEDISGMRIIQIFNREREKYREFKKVNGEYRNAGMKEIVVFGIFRPLIEMLAFLSIASVIWYGGGKVISNALQLGVLYAFISYISQFFQPINDLAEKYNILQSAMASSERIFIILDTPAEKDDGSLTIDTGNLKGSVEFKNVWFSYNGDEWVLRDVSFKVPAGRTVAIVGATGAGKTSIINLINGFYELRRGEILLDGVNIREIRKDSLRSCIGMVLQDVFLFSGTIRDNIRLGSENISEDEIKRVSEYVNADRFINRLAGGYDEEVKERGATFSSGQRQLLAFARALAFDPAILILDEATANIDTETELLIQDALTRITRNRTTIVIAHRLSTIQHADSIIVLHKGKVREVGNHQQLLAQKGMYYNLYNLQYKGMQES